MTTEIIQAQIDVIKAQIVLVSKQYEHENKRLVAQLDQLRGQLSKQLNASSSPTSIKLGG